MRTFQPAEGKGFAWGLGILIMVLAATALPMIITAIAGTAKVGFIIIMSTVSLLCAGMFGYCLWGVSNLQYALEDDHLVIKWAFQNKRIPLQKLRSVSKVIGTGSTKVVGVSWPGFHIGTFSDPRGKGTVNLYATQVLGDIVLLETQWETVGITPKDADEFLEQLHQLVPDLSKEPADIPMDGPVYSIGKDKLYLSCLVGSVVIFAGMFLYLQSILPTLPDQIPMHWNISGEIDRWGSPNEVFIPFGIGVAVTVFLNALTFAVGRNNKMSVRMLGVTGLFISILFSVIALATVSIS